MAGGYLYVVLSVDGSNLDMILINQMQKYHKDAIWVNVKIELTQTN